MMLSIFSPFDSTLLNESLMPLYLMIGFYPYVSMLGHLWVSTAYGLHYMTMMNSVTLNLIKPTSGWYMKGFTYMFLPAFSMILCMNMWGNAPYIFPTSSHLNFTLSMGFMVWSAMIICSISYNMKSSTSHFLPENTPLMMSPFLSLVETLSSYIRPITLSFRLAANISAGHVILGMICSAPPILFFLKPNMIMFPTVLSMMYLSFEFMICGVQAFVFMLLSSMYTSDYIHMK